MTCLTLQTSNWKLQVRAIVHNFRYTKSNLMRLSAKGLILSTQDCVNVSPGFAALFQIVSNNRKKMENSP